MSNNTHPLKVLVVDDEKANLALIEKILQINEFEGVCVSSGEEALKSLTDDSFDVVLLDVMMPKMDGFEVCQRIKENEATRLIPVIIVTALNEMDDKIKGFEAGCDDFLSKPIDKTELIARIRASGRVKRLNDELERAETVVMSLARAVEAKDDTTGDHCDRLIGITRNFGEYLKLSSDDLYILEHVSVLHDVGKIGMPDSILLKPGKLTPEEWEIMRKHPEVGEKICEPLRSLRDICPIIRTHHERWNGSGYPDGLKGEEIPYLARVFQIADAFDALTTKRPYKEAFSTEEALKILKDETTRDLWDPELISRFIEYIKGDH